MVYRGDTIAAKFIGGPADGKVLALTREDVRPEWRFPILPPITSLFVSEDEMDKPLRIQTAVYKLYDNWPVRYVYDRIDGPPD